MRYGEAAAGLGLGRARSPHRANTLFIELLTATIEVENGDRFLVHLPDYRYSSCIVL